MPEVFVGVGSNIDRERNIRYGLDQLRARFGALRTSSAWNTKAVGFDGDDFLNLAVSFRTESGPRELVEALHRIESTCGRSRNTDKEMLARSLDLDLLLYGDSVMDSDGVEVPRAEILEQAYVLAPLAELAPDLRHPVDGRSYAELWRDFAGDRSGVTPTR